MAIIVPWSGGVGKFRASREAAGIAGPFGKLFLLLLAMSAGWAIPAALAGDSPKTVIDNGSSRAWSYQARFAGGQQWSQTLTLAPGQPHAYTTDQRLVVRFQQGDVRTTRVLQPGSHFRYQEDEAGNGDLVDNRNDGPGRLKMRVVTVLAIADESYRKRFPEWQERIAEIVATASTYYEDVFSLRLELVACEAWPLKAIRLGDYGEAVGQLGRRNPAAAELVIGWLGVVQAAPRLPGYHTYTYGWSKPFDRHMLLCDRDTVMMAVRDLIECVGSAFGGAGPDNLPVLSDLDGLEFRETARQAILHNRLHNFLDNSRSGGRKREKKEIRNKDVTLRLPSAAQRPRSES